MRTVRRTAAIGREFTAADRIPYTAHVAPTVVKTAFGDYLQVFRLGGASFETNDDQELNNWHERLNVLWRNIASPHVAVWTQTIRRRFRPVAARERNGSAAACMPEFASALDAKYRARIGGEKLMLNEIYLAVLYRPGAGRAAGLISGLLRRTDHDGWRLELADALDACEKLAQTLRASLARYEPRILGVYHSAARWYSSLLEYLGLLINGEWQRIPLPRGPLNGALASTRLFFGNEAIEYRMASETRFGAMLGIKEYPTPTVVGMFSPLLSAPFAFVLTQSFSFLTKAAGQSLLQRQFNRMANAGDFAVSQAAALQDALDALTSNEFVMGDHHFSLQILADEVGPHPASSGAGRLRALNDQVALARSLLADTGMLVAREDLALEAGFWAQLPGNFPLRPRKAPITSRNFVAMAPFHNYPSGRAVGNHWGEALSLLVTSARSPYHFSLHASDPNDPDGGSRKDTGHTLICGPTGSGKTVFIGFLIAMLCRQGRDASDLRQGSRARDSGARTRRRVPAARERNADGIQSAAAAGHPCQRRISQGLAAGNSAVRAPASRHIGRAGAGAGGSRSGAARYARTRSTRAAPLPPRRVSRPDRSRRAACAPRALVRELPRGIRLGVRQCRRQRRAALDRAPHHRLRRHRIP